MCQNNCRAKSTRDLRKHENRGRPRTGPAHHTPPASRRAVRNLGGRWGFLRSDQALRAKTEDMKSPLASWHATCCGNGRSTTVMTRIHFFGYQHTQLAARGMVTRAGKLFAGREWLLLAVFIAGQLSGPLVATSWGSQSTAQSAPAVSSQPASEPVAHGLSQKAVEIARRSSP